MVFSTYKKMSNQQENKRTERAIAWLSFISADLMGFAALIINDDHDLLSGQLWFIAQMLLLCATILGIDLTITKYFDKFKKK